MWLQIIRHSATASVAVAKQKVREFHNNDARSARTHAKRGAGVMHEWISVSLPVFGSSLSGTIQADLNFWK